MFISRADLRTAEQISVLMKQIQSNAFLSKLPEETLKELCRVMKVQSYYRKDRGTLLSVTILRMQFIRCCSVYSRRCRGAFFYHLGGEMRCLQRTHYAASS